MLNKYSTWMDVLRFAGSRGDRDWVYIITGRPGPTGKTFLYNKLKENGYNAIEISEDIVGLVDYRDRENHYFIDYTKKKLVIVLNRPHIRTGKCPWGSDIHGGFVTTVSQIPYKENKFKKIYDEWIKENPNTDITTLYPEMMPVYNTYISQSRTCGKTLFTKAWMNAMYGTPMYSIKNVIFNDPATIVFWTDGTKTVVKTQEGEIFDPEKGLAMAISKKALGNNREYYHTFLHWLKDYDKKYYWKSAMTDYGRAARKETAVKKAYNILAQSQNDSEVPNKRLNDVLRYLHDVLED
jgi:hypothetical protein